MSTRFKARRRDVERLLVDITTWACSVDNVHALVLVGSYARGQARMGSDVDLTILSDNAEGDLSDGAWFRQLRPGSQLIRSETWGPVQERRYRLRSGLHVELGFAPLSWARVPLDAGTRRVLGDGHRILHDPHHLLAGAVRELQGRNQ